MSYISVVTETTDITGEAMNPNATNPVYPLEFLYDGHCAICRFDVANFRRRDAHQRLRFIDVTAPDFDASVYGRTQAELLARMTARRADGVIVEGPEVFRLAFAAIDLGWLVAPTRLPVFSWITERAYTLFARHRVSLSRRFGGIFRRLTPDCVDGVCHLPERAAAARNKE
jgi:predicted DCC family thiol-disulfide oxidoreductase YuxK